MELQRKLDERLRVKKGVVQDATFITSDPGHAPAETPQGEEAHLGGTVTVSGPRRAAGPAMGRNYKVRWTWIMAWSGTWRRRPLMSMTAGLT